MSYGGPVVVEDISFAVGSGEFFGFMGLNGAGKTTVIKAILKLREQEEGQIKIFNASAESSGVRNDIAYLPERFDPPWFLTGLEFISFSLSLYKQPFDKDEIIAGAQALALDPEVLNKRVQTYSKGMRQKLGLLATIYTKCRLLILDEPMSGLDPKARSLVKDMLLSRKKHGQTIFLCSHILADMDEICDRVALLHEGQLRFIGTPKSLKQEAGEESLERAFLHCVEKDTKL